MEGASKIVKLRSANDLDALLERIGDARIVMLGEASHGTHEYYTWRTAITKRLITEKGFSCIAVEGDWPDCYRINRYVKGYTDTGSSTQQVLKTFNRWPTWMWANWETAALIDWLKDHNSSLPANKRAGFYGLDVYSLWESMEALIEYLEKEDPDAAAVARHALKCFEPYEKEGELYARMTASVPHSCRNAVVNLLISIRTRARYYDHDPEAALNTEQNAHIAVNAEQYYRSMIGFDSGSWNIRDTHMAETLHRLLKFHGERSKVIVWEHNTHIGDARATNMAGAGMVNIGQLAREQYGNDEVVLVGFASYSGSVIAGSSWGSPMQEMEVPEARKGSLEEMLHNESTDNRLIIFDERDERFFSDLPHRAIGVVYDPARERYGNYVPSVISSRYDALIYIDETHALHPIHMPVRGDIMPETYPFGV
jgi:erythromycin esterase